MNEFITALQAYLATQQPNYQDNTESILEAPFDAYNESSGFDNATIKADFEELYRIINDKPLKEIDEIIYAVCTPCRDHGKAEIIECIKVGIALAQEIASYQLYSKATLYFTLQLMAALLFVTYIENLLSI